MPSKIKGRSYESIKTMFRRIVAVVAIVVAITNLVLMALGVIDPQTFVMILLFLFLLSFTYYGGGDSKK